MMAQQALKPAKVATDMYEELKAKATQLVTSSRMEEALQTQVDEEGKTLARLEEVCDTVSGEKGKVEAHETELREGNTAMREELGVLEKAVEGAKEQVQRYKQSGALLEEGVEKVERTWEGVCGQAQRHFAEQVAEGQRMLRMENPSLPADQPLDPEFLERRKKELEEALLCEEGGAEKKLLLLRYPEVDKVVEQRKKLQKTAEVLEEMDREEEVLTAATETAAEEEGGSAGPQSRHTYADRHARLSKHCNVVEELYRDPLVRKELGVSLLAAGDHYREAMKAARVMATNVSEVLAVTHDLERQAAEGRLKAEEGKKLLEALQKQTGTEREGLVAQEAEVKETRQQAEAGKGRVAEAEKREKDVQAALVEQGQLLKELGERHASERAAADEMTRAMKARLEEVAARKEALKEEAQQKAALDLPSAIRARVAELDSEKSLVAHYLDSQRSLDFDSRPLDAAHAVVVLTDQQRTTVKETVQLYTARLEREGRQTRDRLQGQIESINKKISTTFVDSDEHSEALRVLQQDVADIDKVLGGTVA